MNPVHTFAEQLVLQVDTAPRGVTLYFGVAYNVNRVLVCICTMVGWLAHSSEAHAKIGTT